jgi:hypothetical protein
MRKYFSGKSLTKVLNRTRSNPLTFNQQVVYSHLVHLARHDKGGTERAISRATGLDRQKTVSRACEALRERGLAEKRGLYWHALPPAGEACRWFAPRADVAEDAAWPSRWAYWWLGRGSDACPLTTMQLAVYFKMGDIPLADRSQALVCTLLGVDRKTVTTAVAKLRELELMKADTLKVLRPTAAQLGWFRDATPGKEPLQLADLLRMEAFGDSAQSLAEAFTRLVALLTAANYRDGQVRAYFAWAFGLLRHDPQAIELFFWEFEKLFSRVEHDHRVNVGNTGKYRRAANSLGLLKFETRRKMADLRKRCNV